MKHFDRFEDAPRANSAGPMLRKAAKSASLGFCVMLSLLSAAQGATVSYAASSLGGNAWRYDYTLTNTAPSYTFDELTIYFDVKKFDLLTVTAAPVGWDAIVVQPDPGIPADGFFDALALGGMLAQEQRVSGFSVSFAYLGTGSPASQRFDLIDSSTFSLVSSGSTALVPEPETYVLFLLGTVCMAIRERRRCARLRDA